MIVELTQAVGVLIDAAKAYVSSFIFFLFSKVVGSQARILYADHRGRISIAEAFNKAIAEKRLSVRVFSSLCNSNCRRG